jgi:tetratricopeptide (TPR) repeat protein
MKLPALAKLPTLASLKPMTLAAVVIVLVGGAMFLILPLVVGTGVHGYTLSKADHISSWSWKGVYADGGTKQDTTTQQIASLKAELGKGNDYNVYVGIASQYELLGDGKNAYVYLSKAIVYDPKQGLAYMNMGHLMEELGAFNTAHMAYDAAVAAEPNNSLYEGARQNFLVHHPNNQ